MKQQLIIRTAIAGLIAFGAAGATAAQAAALWLAAR